MIRLPWFRRLREDDPAALFARVFRGEDGEKALEYLWGLTLDQATGPNTPDAHLRHLEGQRFVVKQITSLIERGRKGT